MYPYMKKVGRLSEAEVRRRRVFISHRVMRDERNQPIIVGTGSPFFLEFNQPFLQVHKEEKAPMARAITNARKQGRMLPNQNDMTRMRPVQLQSFDTYRFDDRKVLDVYQLYI